MDGIRVVTPNWWAALLAAEVTALAGIVYFLFVATAQQNDPAMAEGRRLYAENCAKCHGAGLEGQPDWMKRKPDGRLPAPPHDESGDNRNTRRVIRQIRQRAGQYGQIVRRHHD